MTADSYVFRSRTSPLSTPHYTTVESVNNAVLSQALNKKQLQRLHELKDEVYPLKLVRALDRISNEESPLVSERKSVFEVIHINNATAISPIVENVSTYSTVQAANDRALDFWAQKYGARMFTDASSNHKHDAMPINTFKHIEEPERHSYHYSPQKNMDYRPTGGIPTNNSYWAINNKCLSLSHKSGKGEKTVYVAMSHVRDQGIHV
ncbi:hypothetical protein F5Y09DRAFT_300996 [Xylaria sp. FL1042]|nr:hypothetical protein F5Y09DRAFT_300996 [Xylaria sp. FL1042]